MLRIQRALDLFDPRESILELAKGKFTTDPVHHSGEGIFCQGFADEVFLVFRPANPQTQLSPIQMNAAVASMVGRVGEPGQAA